MSAGLLTPSVAAIDVAAGRANSFCATAQVNGTRAMVLTTPLAAGIALAWSYWRLHRVLVRLERRRKIAPNPGQGTWNALEGALHRRQRQDRARARRLLRLLRGYRQAATAMHDGALIVQRTTRRITWFNKAACRMLGLHYPRSLDTDLLDAFERCPLPLEQITDDVQLLELIGMPVMLVPGEERNLKLTTPLDLKLAEFLLAPGA